MTFTQRFLRLRHLVSCALLLLAPGLAGAQTHEGEGRTCATWEIHEDLLRTDPDYRRRYEENERFTDDYVRRNAGSGLRSGIFVIPVVVHVVHANDTQNVSDAQIQSQIDVLNADFRRLNADVGLVPAAFKPFAADTRIQFQLARRDPDCNPTNGITRTRTTAAPFNPPPDGRPLDDPVKFTARGGRDIWNRDKYLNLWVAELRTPVLGYAAFPGSPAQIDGVVIDFRAFGTNGTAAAPFNRGRTATHEVGHWLNLRHIWGDDEPPNECTGTDEVADTPNQEGPNYRCPGFPRVTCSNGPNGDMFMNYMDYTDDRCMFMFTSGQALRADAALAGLRRNLAGSDALVPPPGSAGPDVWSQDTATETGDEPNTVSSDFWMSDDIWVRRQNDGLVNQEHQNPEYRAPGGSPNYVYVRVRNRACTGAGSGDVKLYWAKASSGLSWPTPWDGSVTMPALMGNPIGSKPTGSVSAGGFTVLEFPWNPPNPADYGAFGADRSHFCLLSRIETSATPPFGMTFPETMSLGDNVRNNNNIVWKNITVVDEVPGIGIAGWVGVDNYTPDPMIAKLVFRVPKDEPSRPSVFDWGQVYVDLGPELFRRWDSGGRAGSGVSSTGGTELLVRMSGATVENIPMSPGEVFTVRVRFVPGQSALVPGVLKMSLEHYAKAHGAETLVGGQTFVLKGKVFVSGTGSGKALPTALFRHWTHSGEEDAQGIEVYRPSEVQLAPSRGRMGFEIRENGVFVEHRIGPTDIPEEAVGRWRADGNEIVVTFPGEPGSYRLQVLSLDNGLLKVRRKGPAQDGGSGNESHLSAVRR